MNMRYGKAKNRTNRRRYASGKKSFGVCDRTGFKVPYKKLVKEPGTGILVDRSWSDGIWNRVDHPQNFPADVGESIGLRNPRPDFVDANTEFLIDEDGNIVLGPGGIPFVV